MCSIVALSLARIKKKNAGTYKMFLNINAVISGKHLIYVIMVSLYVILCSLIDILNIPYYTILK
jgi:hypothetical protein